VTGTTLLSLRDHEMTTLGAASVVGRALGWYGDEQEASAALLVIDEEFCPHPANARLYDQPFGKYVEFADRLSPMFRPAAV
jgi:sugar (pentulose or hexulose) kinase